MPSSRVRPAARLAGLWALLAAPCAAAGLAPPVMLGAASAAAGSTTLPITTGAACPAGSMIVVFSASNTTSTPNSAADSAANPYNNNTLLTLSGSTGRQRLMFAKPRAVASLPAGGTITITYASTAGTKLSAAACVAGGQVLGASLNDADPAGATGTGTAPAIATPALASPAQIVFCGYLLPTGAGDAFTPTPGFTELTGVQSTAALRWEYQIVASAAPVACAPTLGTSQVWGASVVSYLQTQGVRAMTGAGQ